MIRTFGEISDTAPEGFLSRRVHWTTLTRLDEPTEEGMVRRTIVAAGHGTRELPLSVATQFVTAEGHDGAVLSGRLDKMSIDGNNTEGWGWLLDDEFGRRTMVGVESKALRGNSIDMADVKVEVDFNWDDMDAPIDVVFTKSNVAATTFVMTPAFATAKAEIETELTAALAVEGDLEVTAPCLVDVPQLQALTAATTIVWPHDAFTAPEPGHRQQIEIDRDGTRITGHLGGWGECHTGWLDRCVRIPRSARNYADYCKSKIPTDKGHVYTGPIFLLGGHEATREAINQAAGDVKNAWADVVVTDGEFGPWMCGVVRPGITDEALHAARASRVSGHWLRGELFAICSVSAEGFAGSRATKYAVEMDDEGEVEYLAASFSVGCDCDEDEVGTVTEDELSALIEQARALLEDDDAGAKEDAAA